MSGIPIPDWLLRAQLPSEEDVHALMHRAVSTPLPSRPSTLALHDICRRVADLVHVVTFAARMARANPGYDRADRETFLATIDGGIRPMLEKLTAPDATRAIEADAPALLLRALDIAERMAGGFQVGREPSEALCAEHAEVAAALEEVEGHAARLEALRAWYVDTCGSEIAAALIAD